MNLVVLISGKGTNCEEILKHQELFNYNVSLIVTNRVDYPRFGNRSAAEEYCAKRNNNCKMKNKVNYYFKPNLKINFFNKKFKYFAKFHFFA